MKLKNSEMLKLSKIFQLIWLVTFGFRALVNIFEDFFQIDNLIHETSIIGICFGLAGLILKAKATK